MFLSIEFFGNLEGKLSGGGEDHGLNSAAAQCLVLSQILNERQREPESLTGASEVSNDQILTLPDMVKGLILDWE
jgi:hypothetical protein